MKNLFIYALWVTFASATALADFKLANNGRSVVCYGEDSHSWNLNAARTTLKFTVEGESLGPKRITKVETDWKSWISYTTSEGTLTLGDREDNFRFAGGEGAWPVDCR